MESTATNKSSMSNRLFMNPLVRKLSKVEEYSEESTATYHGIAIKVTYFLFALVVGVVLSFVIHDLYGSGAGITVGGISVSITEASILSAAGILTIITPFLAFLIRPIIPVAGTLYCVGTGYLIAWCATTFADEYAGVVWAALALTILIVLVMAFLYASGIVKVNHKFRAVVSTLFVAGLLGSLACFIGSFIPATRPMVSFVQNNLMLSIGSSVFFVIIASLFLLVDFDTIHHTVEEKLPKKYEWVAAFALTFTVIWLYLKILDLIIRLKGNERK